MGVMTIVVVYLTAVVAVFGCIMWFMHIDRVKSNCCKYGWASFNLFKKKIMELDGQWEWDLRFPNSLFHNESKVHAYIYKFNEIGMIMRTPIDFLMAELFVRKYIRKRFNRIYKWGLAE